ncbi:MAG: DMT family transporter [Rhodospirillales bacterium]|nr:DMT family transporter [Rhodospirillales bacterium]MDE2319903.1 DMT family transporter [Rhodospirillales bacterium]
MSRLTANSLLLLAAALWGGAFVAQAQSAAYLSAGWYTGLRFLLAFLVVLPLGVAEARRAGAFLAGLGGIVPLGLVFAVSSLLQQWALELTSVTHAGFLTGLYVIFVPVLEVIFLRRAPHPLVWLAALLALAGTWLLGGGFNSLSRGDVLVIISAFGFAVQILLMQRVVLGTGRPVAAALGQSLACIVLGSGLGGALPHWHTVASCMPQLLYGGIISGGLGFLLQAICQRHTGATDTAVILMAESLFAALFAAIILHERMSHTGWLGCMLLFAALVLAQVGPVLMPRRVAVGGSAEVG